MSTDTTTRIICRADIDRILGDIQSFADWHAKRHRDDIEAPIGAVFTAEEEAAELNGHVHTLEQLVMLPQDLFEELWTLLETLEQEVAENNEKLRAPEPTPRFTALLDRLEQYNNS